MRLCLKNPKESIKRLLELINRFYKVAGSSKKQESSRKVSISALLTMPKSLTVWIAINCGKFWRRWEYQTTWPASWETCMQTRKQQLELDLNNRLVPNRKRSMSRLYIVTLLTYMQSTSWETLGWKKHNLVKAMIFQWSCMGVRVGLWRKLSTEE